MQNFEKSSKKQKTAPKLDLLSQVALDISNYIDQFPNKTFALKRLSIESGLNEKTLRRLLKKENIPSPQTLNKIYYVTTLASCEEELLAHCPETVKEQLERLDINRLKKETPRQYDFFELVDSDPIIAEVYSILGTQNLDMSEVVYRFGQYGADVLTKLHRLGIVQEIDKGIYSFSDKQPHLDAPILKNLGMRLTKRYLKPDSASIEGENFVSLYCEGLNEDGKKKWLEIDQKAFEEKVKVANNDKFSGKLPMFTFQATDNLSETVKEREI
jgi:hypothetical protein